MLKQALKTFIRLPKYPKYYTPTRLNNNLPYYNFCSEQDPIKGFEKFKRRTKKKPQQNSQDEQQETKNNEQEQKVEKQQKQEVEDIKEAIKKEHQEQKQEQQQQKPSSFLKSKIDEITNSLENKVKQQDQQDQQEIEDLYTPQGFDKFKRKRKGKQNLQQEKQEQEQADQKIEEENKQDQDQDKNTQQSDLEKEYREKSEKIRERSEKFKEKNPEEDDKIKPAGFTQNKDGLFQKKKKKEKKDHDYEPQMFKEDNNNNQSDSQQNKDNNNNNKNENKSFFQQLGWRGWMLMGLGATVVVTKLAEEQNMNTSQISYSEFFKFYAERDQVLRISINRSSSENIGGQRTVAKIVTKNAEERRLIINHLEHFLTMLEKVQQKLGKTPNQYIPIDFQYTVENGKTVERIVNIMLLGATLTIVYMMFKSVKVQMNNFKNMGGGGGPGDMTGLGGQSKVKIYGLDSKIDVKFKDVAGQDEQKQEIMEFVDFLKNPKKYTDLGAKIPKGALLSGPPGTGKTLLAKACAGEAEVPFLFMSGSDFVEMYVGVGSSRVRDLFKQAKQKAPSIIFIDEIDAVGKKRNSSGKGGNDERDNTLNQLLVEMDGFGTSESVIVLAATNRADMLDPALKRPGRFDRSIEVTLPDIDGRKEIFKVHLKELKLDLTQHTREDYAKRLATLTPGFSGADVANLCNEAALLAARKNKEFIQTIDFEMASERVMAGLKKNNLMPEEERRVVAVHEAGHAVVGWFLEGGHPLIKVTIIPRSKGSLGYAQYLPNENSLDTKEELLDRICGILGGRVAEEIFFGRITTGAGNDLEKAYKMAFNMVEKLGMSEEIGYIGYVDQHNKVYSKATNEKIDKEVARILNEQTERCRQVITQYKEQIENLSDALMEKETLDLKQITSVLGERPFEAKSNYKAYLESNEKIQEEIKLQQQQEEEENQKQQQQQEDDDDKKNNQQEQEQNVNKEQENNQKQQ